MNVPASASLLDTSALDHIKQMQFLDNNDCEFECAYHRMLRANFLPIKIRHHFQHTLNYEV